MSALNLRVYKNILNGATRKAKYIHYAHLFDLYKTNMRKTWETIKQVLNKNHKQFEFPSTFTINGINISDKKEIAQQFNNFFVNIGSQLAETISSKHQAKPFDSYLKLKFSQYSSIHTNDIIPHCTTLQYNHNI